MLGTYKIATYYKYHPLQMGCRSVVKSHGLWLKFISQSSPEMNSMAIKRKIKENFPRDSIWRRNQNRFKNSRPGSTLQVERVRWK